MTVEIESVLGAEDVRQVIETAEQAGSLRASELAELVEAHELSELEAEALHRECEQRGIDIVEEKEEAAPPPQPIVGNASAVTTKIIVTSVAGMRMSHHGTFSSSRRLRPGSVLSRRTRDGAPTNAFTALIMVPSPSQALLLSVSG